MVAVAGMGVPALGVPPDEVVASHADETITSMVNTRSGNPKRRFGMFIFLSPFHVGLFPHESLCAQSFEKFGFPVRQVILTDNP
jgi:hypothetical protein